MSAAHRFEQIADELREQILDGTYPPGEPLPHTRDLLDRFGVSATTLTRALKILKEQQLVWRVANRGMVVQDHQPTVVDIPLSVLTEGDDVEWTARCQRANVPGVVAVIGSYAKPTWNDTEPDVAQALNIPDARMINFYAQAGMIRKLPVYVTEVFYPAALKGSHPTTVVRQLISARPATASEANHLRLPRGSWVLAVERLSCDEQGRPVELLRIAINPLRVRLLEEDLPLTPSA
ncbi:GntR family transcriptional regulator [Streptosporangium canum]|uniref:GntR family transcriptional regulator n=1 Tax=Streptosporangium canum TaxID=324952 RepID=UPI0037883234